MPVVSTVRSTPCTALTVPIASMPGVHRFGSAVTVDTVAAGGSHAGEILLDGAIAEQVEPDQAAAHNHQENEGNEEALDHAYTGTEAKNSRKAAF